VSEQSDRLKAPFVGIVQALTGKYDYSGVFAGRVSKQNPTTYAVDVVLDSQSLPDPVNVDIRGAAPGMRVKVAPGTRVGIVYDNQDPSKPKATLFEADPGLILAPPAPTQTIEVDLFATTAVKLGSASCLPLVQAPAYLAAEETALGSAAGVGLVFADLSALATALTSLVVALEAVSAIAAPPLTAALEGLRDVCTQLTKDLTTATTNLNAFTGGQAGFQTKITEAS
jgi:hypothetical protein